MATMVMSEEKAAAMFGADAVSQLKEIGPEGGLNVKFKGQPDTSDMSIWKQFDGRIVFEVKAILAGSIYDENTLNLNSKKQRLTKKRT